MTISYWQANGSQREERVDVLIIGAGLVGLAAADFVQQMGHSVMVVDKAGVAMGASGRNAGFMITGLDTYYHRAVEKYGRDVAHEMWDISQKSIAYWKDVVKLQAGTVDYEETGSLVLAESEEEAEELHLAYDALQADGFEGYTYHADDPLNRGYFAAIENPTDAMVNPYHLAHALKRMGKAYVIAPSPVYALEQNDDVVKVYAQNYIYKAKYVLLCTNAYSSQLDPYFEDKVIPNRAQVLMTAPLDKPILPSVGYSNYGYMYYRMTFDNNLLIGGARHLHGDTENNTTEDIVSKPVQASLEAYMKKHFPDVTQPVTRRWGGIMGFSVDGLPLVGTLPNRDRIGFAVGFTGHGISMGAETARRAVKKLLKGEHAGAIDVSRFDE